MMFFYTATFTRKRAIFNLNSGVTLIHISLGAVSDGEFNSLRTQGSTRPLHVWQLIHDAKESVSRQSERTLMAMLKRIGGQFVYDSCIFSPSQVGGFIQLYRGATLHNSI